MTKIGQFEVDARRSAEYSSSGHTKVQIIDINDTQYAN